MTVNIANIQGYVLTHPNNNVNVANIQGYALVSPPSPIALRTIGGYAMGMPPNSVQLRSLNGYALTPFSKLPAGVTGATSLMAMILAKAKSTRPATHFNLGAVEVGTITDYNTKVKVTPTALAKLSGEMYFHYNRIYMNRLPDLSSVVIGAETTTRALISKINAVSDVQLTADDIVDEAISSEMSVVTIKAAPTSYIFVPGTTISVGKDLPPFSSAFTDPTIRWS